MTALALRDDQAYWDENQLAVLRSNGIDEGVSRPELQSFLHECQRRKLDPFTRQIYLIGRYDKKAGRTVYRSQTSIDGFRLIARRSADNSGIDYAYEDTIWFDENGQRHEVWLSDKPPAAAKVVVVRNGNRHDAVARYGAYVQANRDGEPLGLWRNMPDTMVAKCAEALALRKAFPEDLGGLYTAEEMAQADNPAPVVTATATVVRDAPAGGNGHAVRPAQAPRPAAAQPGGEPDPEAQPYADEAHEARVTETVKDIHNRARDTHKLAALIRNPATGGVGGLGQYLNHRRSVLQKAEQALAALRAAGAPAGLDDSGIEQLLRDSCSHGIEEASAEEMAQVTELILKETGAAA